MLFLFLLRYIRSSTIDEFMSTLIDGYKRGEGYIVTFPDLYIGGEFTFYPDDVVFNFGIYKGFRSQPNIITESQHLSIFESINDLCIWMVEKINCVRNLYKIDCISIKISLKCQLLNKCSEINRFLEEIIFLEILKSNLEIKTANFRDIKITYMTDQDICFNPFSQFDELVISKETSPFRVLSYVELEKTENGQKVYFFETPIYQILKGDDYKYIMEILETINTDAFCSVGRNITILNMFNLINTPDLLPEQFGESKHVQIDESNKLIYLLHQLKRNHVKSAYIDPIRYIEINCPSYIINMIFLYKILENTEYYHFILTKALVSHMNRNDHGLINILCSLKIINENESVYLRFENYTINLPLLKTISRRLVVYGDIISSRSGYIDLIVFFFLQITYRTLEPPMMYDILVGIEYNFLSKNFQLTKEMVLNKIKDFMIINRDYMTTTFRNHVSKTSMQH